MRCRWSNTAGEPCRPSVPRTTPHRRAEAAVVTAARRSTCIRECSYTSWVSTLPYGSYLVPGGEGHGEARVGRRAGGSWDWCRRGRMCVRGDGEGHESCARRREGRDNGRSKRLLTDGRSSRLTPPPLV
eukprot:scaffold3183_cov120-Isochrysis_galbana.AAC.3